MTKTSELVGKHQLRGPRSQENIRIHLKRELHMSMHIIVNLSKVKYKNKS